MKPKRIQLSRRKGWRKPPNCVVVARPTKWGNPFPVHSIPSDLTADTLWQDMQHGICYTRAAAVNQFRRYISRTPQLRADARRELRGKTLACWCPIGEPCHADVLLEIANKR